MLQQPHLLIAGATGAGKSVLMHHLIDIIFLLDGSQIILIDTKKVELHEFKHDRRTLAYTDDIPTTIQALNKAIHIMNSRLQYLRSRNLKQYDHAPLYILIDEFADLVLLGGSTVNPLIIKIATLGRAANIHLILCTQRPTADVINKRIAVNLSARVCLRVACAVDSRNVIGCSGAELLPKHGQGIYWIEGCTYNITIPPPTDHAIIQAQRTNKSNINSIWIWICFIILLVMLLV